MLRRAPCSMYVIARRLLAQGANINATDDSGKSVLFLACEGATTQMVQWLIDQHANVKSSGALCAAARRGHAKIVDVLLRNEAEPMHTWFSYTAVDFAVTEEIMLKLVRRGAEPSISDCVRKGWTELACELCDRFPTCIERPGQAGVTPVENACKKGNVKALKHLIHNHGAQPNRKNALGEVPLFLAARAGHVECVEVLLGLNEKKLVVPVAGSRALTIASHNSNKRLVEVLLEAAMRYEKDILADILHETYYGNDAFSAAKDEEMFCSLVTREEIAPALRSDHVIAVVRKGWYNAYLEIFRAGKHDPGYVRQMQQVVERASRSLSEPPVLDSKGRNVAEARAHRFDTIDRLLEQGQEVPAIIVRSHSKTLEHCWVLPDPDSACAVKGKHEAPDALSVRSAAPEDRMTKEYRVRMPDSCIQLVLGQELFLQKDPESDERNRLDWWRILRVTCQYAEYLRSSGRPGWEAGEETLLRPAKVGEGESGKLSDPVQNLFIGLAEHSRYGLLFYLEGVTLPRHGRDTEWFEKPLPFLYEGHRFESISVHLRRLLAQSSAQYKCMQPAAQAEAQVQDLYREPLFSIICFRGPMARVMQQMGLSGIFATGSHSSGVPGGWFHKKLRRRTVPGNRTVSSLGVTDYGLGSAATAVAKTLGAKVPDQSSKQGAQSPVRILSPARLEVQAAPDYQPAAAAAAAPDSAANKSFRSADAAEELPGEDRAIAGACACMAVQMAVSDTCRLRLFVALHRSAKRAPDESAMLQAAQCGWTAAIAAVLALGPAADRGDAHAAFRSAKAQALEVVCALLKKSLQSTEATNKAMLSTITGADLLPGKRLKAVVALAPTELYDKDVRWAPVTVGADGYDSGDPLVQRHIPSTIEAAYYHLIAHAAPLSLQYLDVMQQMEFLRCGPGFTWEQQRPHHVLTAPEPIYAFENWVTETAGAYAQADSGFAGNFVSMLRDTFSNSGDTLTVCCPHVFTNDVARLRGKVVAWEHDGADGRFFSRKLDHIGLTVPVESVDRPRDQEDGVVEFKVGDVVEFSMRWHEGLRRAVAIHVGRPRDGVDHSFAVREEPGHAVISKILEALAGGRTTTATLKDAQEAQRKVYQRLPLRRLLEVKIQGGAPRCGELDILSWGRFSCTVDQTSTVADRIGNPRTVRYTRQVTFGMLHWAAYHNDERVIAQAIEIGGKDYARRREKELEEQRVSQDVISKINIMPCCEAVVECDSHFLRRMPMDYTVSDRVNAMLIEEQRKVAEHFMWVPELDDVVLVIGVNMHSYTLKVATIIRKKILGQSDDESRRLHQPCDGTCHPRRAARAADQRKREEDAKRSGDGWVPCYKCRCGRCLTHWLGRQCGVASYNWTPYEGCNFIVLAPSTIRLEAEAQRSGLGVAVSEDEDPTRVGEFRSAVRQTLLRNILDRQYNSQDVVDIRESSAYTESAREVCESRARIGSGTVQYQRCPNSKCGQLTARPPNLLRHDEVPSTCSSCGKPLSASYKGQHLLDTLLAEGKIASIFGVHDLDEVKHVLQVWRWQPFAHFAFCRDYLHEPPLRPKPEDQYLQQAVDLKSYLGAQIAFYFVFVSFYVSWLIPLAITGIFMTIPQGYESYENRETTLENPITMANAIIVIFWAQVFINRWERKQSELATLFGTRDCEHTGSPSEAFIEWGRRNRTPLFRHPVTGRMEPKFGAKERFPRLCATWAFTVFYIGLVVMAVWGNLVLRYDFDPHGTDTMKSMISSLINAVSIQLLDVGYTLVVGMLVDFENHRTRFEREQSQLQKLFLFRYINGMGGLLGPFFVRPPHSQPNSLGPSEVLGMQLASILGMQFVVSTLKEKILVAFYLQYTTREVNVSISKQREEDTYKMEGLTPGQKARLRTYHMRHQAIILDSVKPSMDDADGTDLFDDYSMVAVQFAYVVSFASVLPLAPCAACLISFLELHSDLHKYLLLGQRPNPVRASGIGAWVKVFNLVIYLAIPINSVIMFNGDRESWRSHGWPSVIDEWAEKETCRKSMGLLAMIIILMTFKALAKNAMKPIALWVFNEDMRQRSGGDELAAWESAVADLPEEDPDDDSDDGPTGVSALVGGLLAGKNKFLSLFSKKTADTGGEEAAGTQAAGREYES
eukprot:TRINITY_DN11107_c0_g2_i2.p1 TRINITY_DN11107_c0_g2~~TRINITY_DN11107_c0_g2_i2.p1  ORF type:complete len:2109 (+),score=724.13 TRINITY_DN11107_c0_g2_i2:5893-12219(+)